MVTNFMYVTNTRTSRCLHIDNTNNQRYVVHQMMAQEGDILEVRNFNIPAHPAQRKFIVVNIRGALRLREMEQEGESK
jgi:hypothetical protein